MKEIKESICTIGLNKESKFIEVFTERECVVFIVFSPGSLSVLLYSVTGDTVPYLKCSGGDYIFHHNTNTNSFICTQLNSFKHCSLTIQHQ